MVRGYLRVVHLSAEVALTSAACSELSFPLQMPESTWLQRRRFSWRVALASYLYWICCKFFSNEEFFGSWIWVLNRHIYLLNHCQTWGFYLFVSCGKEGFQIILLLRGNWKQDLFLVLIWVLKMDQWKPVITLIYLKVYYVHFAKMLRGKSFAFAVVWPEAKILYEAVWRSQNIIIHIFLCIQYNSLARQSVPVLKYI